MESSDSNPREITSHQGTRDSHLQHGESHAIANQQLPALQPIYRSDNFHPTNSQLSRPSSQFLERSSYSSNMPFVAGAATPGSITPISTPDVRSSRYSGRSIPLEDYHGSMHYPMQSYYNDSPYRQSAHKFDPTVSDASINPYDIEDDGDDGFMPNPKRKSALPLHAFRSKGTAASTVGSEHTAVAGGPSGGVSGKQVDNKTMSGSYGPVDGASGGEKAGWLANERRKKKRRKIVIMVGMFLVVLLVIVAGVIGGVLGSHNARGSESGGSTNNADSDTAANGDLDLNSAEIKKLMNNPNLHKVFPGMDYTPWGVQYPLCLTYPPSQNNVTRDVAVLSQLTNTIRLYGTDCNQTEMVQHAIDKLQLKNMKIWLGVWVDTNTTTTERQIANMYKILANTKDKSIFKGAIIGNEALYRAGEDKAQSKQELITLLTETRSNFTSLGYNLPIATSDLGDNWTSDLVAVSDYVMSNIHPFFAGVTADVAAAWTWNFWQTKDYPLTAGTNVKQIISETGWPSGGGTDCGGSDGSCTPGQSGSVASVANMNTFMNTWVCQALTNGTDYFWYDSLHSTSNLHTDIFPGSKHLTSHGKFNSTRLLSNGKINGA